jgi:hypothetical protein
MILHMQKLKNIHLNVIINFSFQNILNFTTDRIFEVLKVVTMKALSYHCNTSWITIIFCRTASQSSGSKSMASKEPAKAGIKQAYFHWVLSWLTL